jgi:hypothetical protein
MAAALDRALEDERLRSVRFGFRLRAAGTTAYLLVAAGLALGVKFPTARAVLPIAAIYACAAWLCWLAMRLQPALAARIGIYSIPFLDMPCLFFALSRAIAAASPVAAAFHAGGLLSAYLMLLIGAQLALDSRYVVVTAATGLFFEVLLIAKTSILRNPIILPLQTLMVGVATVIAIYVPRRMVAFLRRVVDESEARVREVQVLNEELRRQIGDRAAQLAEALARLESPLLSAPRLLEPGALVEDRYKVVRPLGSGGMGVVSEVERLADGKRLALKMLSRLGDRDSLSRFAREAQIAAQLDHPNVVGVLDVDVARSGLLFLVMELVPGKTAEGERERFGDARWAVPLLRQVASALAAVHARGIVHRDLKPSNILIDEAGRAKVADFGIASLFDGDTLDPPRASDSTPQGGLGRLTRTGSILGTPCYMAPELTQGARRATPASDVFSLGVVAFELLTGRLPHATSPVIEQLAGRVAPQPVGLAELRADLPPLLVQLVDRCLLEEPEHRPTSAAISATLDAIGAQTLPAGRPTSLLAWDPARSARTRV